jgi:uncharacterized FlaG/YvyC family protein
MNVQSVAAGTRLPPLPAAGADQAQRRAEAVPSGPPESAQNEFLQAASRLREAVTILLQTYAARYRLEPDTHTISVQIVDRGSGEVIREIPPEALLRFAKAWDAYVGNLLDRQT